MADHRSSRAARSRPARSTPSPMPRMMAGRSSLRLGDAGGLTQFGANLVTLEPGARSSLRHWHRARGRVRHGDRRASASLVAGRRAKRRCAPATAPAFPAGDANGHHFVNRTDARGAIPRRSAAEAPREVATYSDVDLTRRAGGRHARGSPTATAPTGRDCDDLAQGRHRAGLGFGLSRSLHTIWATTAPIRSRRCRRAHAVRRLHRDADARARKSRCATGTRPRTSSSMSSTATVTLIEDDGEHALSPGDAACWPAGRRQRRIAWSTAATARPRYLIVGTARRATTACHYPDHRPSLYPQGRRVRDHVPQADGTPYPGWPKET